MYRDPSTATLDLPPHVEIVVPETHSSVPKKWPEFGKNHYKTAKNHSFGRTGVGCIVADALVEPDLMRC